MPYLGRNPDKGNFSDLNGAKLIIDADADTSITADTDDQIDIEISGADDFQFTANTFTVLSGSTLTIASGATIANSGTATGFSSADPTSADGDTLGTASAEWSDLYLADGGVIYFGNDQEVTLTHNHDTSLTCNLMVAATTFEPTGDTAAGDNSALGYTSVLGAILTGQGSTNDVTLVNDADATVLGIATGTTNVDVVGDITAATLNADGDTAAGDNAAIGYTASEGLILTGQGSTNDITIKRDDDTAVLEVATGQSDIEITGGDLFFGTAGKGIVLGATTNTDANTLEDYEEGTWTAVFLGGTTAGSPTTPVGFGTYTKIGTLVHVDFQLYTTDVDTAAGSLLVGGIPFAMNSSSAYRAGGAYGNLNKVNFASGDLQINTYGSSSYTSIVSIFHLDNSSSTAVLVSDFTDGGWLMGSLSYTV